MLVNCLSYGPIVGRIVYDMFVSFHWMALNVRVQYWTELTTT